MTAMYNHRIRLYGKLFIAGVLNCLIQFSSNAQSVVWPLNNTTAPTISGCFSATNATVVGAANPGFQTCGQLGYYADTWEADLSVAYTDYFEFTMTTCPGWIATITTINTSVYAAFPNCAAHQDEYRIRYSTNGFSTKTNLTALSFTDGGPDVWTTENHTGLSINLPGNTTLSIRVYFDQNNGGQSNIRNYVGSLTASGTMVLPIDLVKFKGEQSNGQTKLEWSTASETNNSYFTVERSQNGMDFTPIETIKGNINSNSTLNYSTIDENPGAGINYYRLKQTDLNGEFKYSHMISVSEQPVITALYPNPTVNDTKLDFYSPSSASAQIEILDLAGRTVLSKVEDVVEGNQAFTIPMSELDKGAYYLKISIEDLNYSYSNKLIKN